MIHLIEPHKMANIIHTNTFKVNKRVPAKNFLLTIAILLVIAVSPSLRADTDRMENCLLEVIKDAKNDQTIGEIRKQCSKRHAQQDNLNHPVTGIFNELPNQKLTGHLENKEKQGVDPVAKRIALEEEVEFNPFVLTAHKPNYFLPYAYNFDPNDEPFQSELGDKKMDKPEVKFQVSLKFPIWKGIYKGHGDLYLAYTNLSFWQAYNSDFSRPFRETNHEPEIFLSFKNSWNFWGISNELINIGIVHQSNGQSGHLSRGWNRIYAKFVFQKDNFTVSVKPWLRFSNVDDNPDIEKYLGHGELRVGYKWRKHTFSSMLRNNFRSDNKGALELGWSFPLFSRGRVRGYAQYFYGYGESLIDYNESTNRLSVGIALTDWM